MKVMDVKVIEFFEKNKFPLGRMFKRGRGYRLSEVLVQVGMQRVYQRVEAGEKIKRIMLAREAFSEAKKVDDEEIVERLKILTRVDVRFDELRERLDRLEFVSVGLKRRRWWYGRSDV